MHTGPEIGQETGRTRFAATVTLAFLVAGGIGVAHHEMWRDEVQTWLTVLGSPTPADLLHNSRYDGHPNLWYWILFLASQLSRRLETMQVVHLAIAAAAVFLFARNAPFPRPIRALFAFGYFPLYEYGVISRNYGLGLLTLLAALSLLETRSRTYLPLALALGLMANTNPYAWIVALAFAGTLAVEALAARKLHIRDALASLVLFGTLAAHAAARMIPPPDGRYATRWYLTWNPGRFLQTLGTVARVWLPLPDPRSDAPWNTSLLSLLPGTLTAVLSALLIAAAAAYLARHRSALLLYLGGTAALLGFTYVKYLGFLRHQGHHFVLLIACLWLAGRRDRRSALPLALLLGLHAIAGAWLYALDLQRPFSNAKAVAALLSEPRFDDRLIVGRPDLMATPVSGYLGRPLFHLESRRLGTYILFSQERKPSVGFREACRLLRRQLKRHPEGLVLITVQPPPICGAKISIEELASFQASLVPDERYRVVLLQAR